MRIGFREAWPGPLTCLFATEDLLLESVLSGRVSSPAGSTLAHGGVTPQIITLQSHGVNIYLPVTNRVEFQEM